MNCGRTLAELYKDCGFFPKFRVRHVVTLEDYCITGVSQWRRGVFEGEPLWFAGLRLDHDCQECELPGDLARYVMLSAQDEVRHILAYQDSALVRMYTHSYFFMR